MDIIVLGSGGHAQSCIDVIEDTGLFNILGIIEKKNHKQKNKNDSNFFPYQIIGDDSELGSLFCSCKKAFSKKVEKSFMPLWKVISISSAMPL